MSDYYVYVSSYFLLVKSYINIVQLSDSRVPTKNRQGPAWWAIQTLVIKRVSRLYWDWRQLWNGKMATMWHWDQS